MDGESALGGLDTRAEASVVRRGLVRKHWKVRQKGGTAFDGLGSTGAKLGEDVDVPVQQRYGSELIRVGARVVEDSEMPGGVDIHDVWHCIPEEGKNGVWLRHYEDQAQDYEDCD